MINIRKRAFTGLSIIISVLAVTACGSSDKSAVKETSEAFMEAVKTGDTDGINKYSASDVANGYFVSLFDSEYLEEQLLSSLGNPSLEDETIAKMDEFYSMYASMMDKYEVTEITLNDDGSATASVTMTNNFPFDIITSGEISNRFYEESIAYNEENQEEIARITEEEGTDAAMDKAYNDLILIAMDIYEDAVKEAEPVTYKIALGLEKNTETGEWYVKSVQSHDSQVAGTGAPATKTDTSATESSSIDISTEEISSSSEASSN